MGRNKRRLEWGVWYERFRVARKEREKKGGKEGREGERKVMIRSKLILT